MKTTYLLLTLVMAISTNPTIAQMVFAPDGAVWHYGASSMMASGGYCRFDIMGDTLIEGHDCKRINRTTYYFYPVWNTFDTLSGPEFFSFTDQDRVYFYLDNQLDTLFDFSLQTGDTYKISFGDYCDTAVVQVTETGTLFINDMVLRYYNAETISDLESTWAVGGTMVERIGSLGYLLGNPTCEGDEDGAGGLRCYSDPAFGWYGTVEEDMCDFIIGIDEINSMHHQILVFPNPMHGMLNMAVGTHTLNHEPISIEIANMQGQMLSSFELKHIETTCVFDVSALASGVYLLVLRKNGMVLQTETIVVE